jgi:hypothetical protein
MALKQDSLLWDVTLEPVYLASGEQVPGYQAAVRDDTNAVLAIHGSRYEEVTNRTIRDLAEVFAGEAGASVRGSWSVKGGAVVGIQLENGLFTLPGDPSEFRDFFVLGNSHDGSMLAKFHPTQQRIICVNTFYRAMYTSQSASGYTFKHTSGITGRIAEVRAALKVAAFEREAFAEWAESLMHKEASEPRFLDSLVGEYVIGDELDAADRAINDARDVLASVIARPTQNGTTGAWRLFNAGVEYLDHFAEPRRKVKGHEERKLLRTIGLVPGKERVASAVKASLLS